MTRVEKIQIGNRTYTKFLPYPKAVRDGTVRCIACGQIDEPKYHEDEHCPACGGSYLSPLPSRGEG